ncbi:MAG: alanine racemase [Candidatus Binatia bacterium]|nr:alanine racemase [Candidatus Binatia bacterium]
MYLHDVATPALVIDAAALEHNLRTMAERLPGQRLRPHVKAHKCTALAKLQQRHGHPAFCCATVREAEGLALAGLGEDLLLANEVLDVERLARLRYWPVIVAVDSSATIAAAAKAGIRRVIIDVNVGLPRCGCAPERAGALAEEARRAGLEVVGVMGYEGHAVGIDDRALRESLCAAAMKLLLAAHREVGGDIVSAGGTGTFDLNQWATEIQAGSYALMDTQYAKLGLPFRQALFVWATVISVSDHYAVADCGLKSLGMDHGNPAIDDAQVLFCSDEHVTFVPTRRVAVGEKIKVWPAHVDPTVAYHERMLVTDGERVIESWPVDLRGW